MGRDDAGARLHRASGGSGSKQRGRHTSRHDGRAWRRGPSKQSASRVGCEGAPSRPRRIELASRVGADGSAGEGWLGVGVEAEVGHAERVEDAFADGTQVVGCGRVPPRLVARRHRVPAEEGVGELALAGLHEPRAGLVVLEVAIPRDAGEARLFRNHGLDALGKGGRVLAAPQRLGLQVPYVANDGPGGHESQQVGAERLLL
mmetsp:Transcript_16272/g.28100  ORF Transcript_16272/g.28100 Transcript_16272/m.28100 type:complete len:203 (+) Transcript_16272:511-1119(+)